jgi:hypothetical protein
MGLPMDRRGFFETSALLTGGALLTRVADLSTADPPTIGIQSGAVSFVDEGTEKVLDVFQESAVNTIFLAMFTYGRGSRLFAVCSSRFGFTVRG